MTQIGAPNYADLWSRSCSLPQPYIDTSCIPTTGTKRLKLLRLNSLGLNLPALWTKRKISIRLTRRTKFMMTNLRQKLHSFARFITRQKGPKCSLSKQLLMTSWFKNEDRLRNSKSSSYQRNRMKNKQLLLWSKPKIVYSITARTRRASRLKSLLILRSKSLNILTSCWRSTTKSNSFAILQQSMKWNCSSLKSRQINQLPLICSTRLQNSPRSTSSWCRRKPSNLRLSCLIICILYFGM